MFHVIEGVSLVALVAILGWGLRRAHLIPDSTSKILVDLSYWALSPALMFSTLAKADIRSVFGVPLAVTAIAGVFSALIFFALQAIFLRLKGGDVVLGTMSSSVNNGAHIGIPVALYVLGDVAFGIPVMVFQLGFFTPFFFVLADIAGAGKRPTVMSVLRTIVLNPMVIASFSGFFIAWFSFPLPSVILNTTTMIGDAAPPIVLIAFGASLVGQRLQSHPGIGKTVVLVSFVKLVVQPAIAFGFGVLLGVEGRALMALCVMASLPAAQNAFVAAVRARTGQGVATASVMVTTILCLPVIIVVAGLFFLFQ